MRGGARGPSRERIAQYSFNCKTAGRADAASGTARRLHRLLLLRARLAVLSDGEGGATFASGRCSRTPVENLRCGEERRAFLAHLPCKKSEGGAAVGRHSRGARSGLQPVLVQ